MSKPKEITQVQEPLTVKSVLNNFLTSHNLLDVLDTVRDAQVALHLKGQDELEEAVDKEDYLSIAEGVYDNDTIMNTVITFIANIVHLQTKNQ